MLRRLQIIFQGHIKTILGGAFQVTLLSAYLPGWHCQLSNVARCRAGRAMMGETTYNHIYGCNETGSPQQSESMDIVRRADDSDISAIRQGHEARIAPRSSLPADDVEGATSTGQMDISEPDASQATKHDGSLQQASAGAYVKLLLLTDVAASSLTALCTEPNNPVLGADVQGKHEAHSPALSAALSIAAHPAEQAPNGSYQRMPTLV